VVYPRAPNGADTSRNGLYRVPLAGGTPLALATPSQRSVIQRPEITADNARVVFVAEATDTRPAELYSTPLAGGPFVQLSPALVADGAVRLFRLSPDGARVAFWLDSGAFTITDLYTVPVDGGTTAVKLNDPLANGTSVGEQFSFSPDGKRIVFLALPATASDNKQRLFSVPADGSAAAVTLAEPPEVGALFDEPRVTPDGRLVVFAAERALAGNFVYDLLAVPLAGGSAPVTLTSTAIPATFSVYDGRSRFPVTADSRRVVFRSPANPMFAQYGLQSLAVAELRVPGTTVAALTPQGGTLASGDGRVTVEFATGAVTVDVTVEHEPLAAAEPALPAGQTAMRVFALTARDGQGRAVTQFGAPVTLRVRYSEIEVAAAGLDERSLNVVYWNGVAWTPLLPCSGCGVDTDANQITVVLDHFTPFALVGSAAVMPEMRPWVYLPLV
jgi:hypothetical protein